MPAFITKKRVSYLVLGVASYLFFLIANVPASIVFKNYLPTGLSSIIKYQGISGTVWQGQASQLSIKQVPLGKVKWELSAIPLLWGTADIKVSGNREDALLISNASLSASKIQLHDTRLELPIADLMPLFYGFPISLDGKINASLSTFELSVGKYFIIEGRAVMTDVKFIAPQAFSLGDLVIKFEKQDNGTRISINNQQGRVQVDAVVTLAETGFYTVNALLTPRTSADNEIKTTLAMLGKQDNQGRYAINTRGRLPF